MTLPEGYYNLKQQECMFMNKGCKLLFVLLVAVFVFSSLTGAYRILPMVKATYVEGTITQDTDWTLVDSPFIVSNNIIVNPGVMLTIEPGVEVRFGQDFSITVNGRIIADGTDDKTIRFTSDNLNPSTGDWGTILINGTQQSSITHCIIEYGTSGVTLENGTLDLQNNFLRFNSNGAMLDGGNIIIQNNEIINNSVSGINIAGDSQATIGNNAISSNGDGIVLDANLTGNVNISQNNIFFNGQSGIFLESGTYYNMAILENNVSSNNYGFRVATNSSTYITHNYISNNTVGIFYENGISHEAHFNDIYNNTVGIDVSPTASVSATYNYWGDQSGPFHISLNPDGKGNKVGGDGVNLDFIFFLSAPINYNNAAPTAVLQTDKNLVAPNENVTFIGTNSYDDGRVDQYFFDFGDGADSGWTTLSLFNHIYSTSGTYSASLKVMDDFNATSQNVATTTVTVQDLTPLNVSVSLDKQIINFDANVSVTVYVSDNLGGIENANVAFISLRGGTFSFMSGSTNSSGYFDAVFTAPNGTRLSNVRIIATAAKPGYADGSSHIYLEVLPPLQIRIAGESLTLKSEETEAMTVYVTDALGQPVSNASIVLFSDNGTLSTSSGTTDADGIMTFNFSAPYTLSPMNVTITATVAKSEYADTVSQIITTIEPKVLTAQVTTESSAALSEANVTVNVRVTYDAAPVQDANVTLASDKGGNFSQPTAVTDSNGTATFVFTAPPANVQLNATVTAQASKIGYIDGQDSSTISVSPRNMIVQIQAISSVIESSSTTIVTVTVASNATPVADAQVTLTANVGNFSATNLSTDSNGTCTLVFQAPFTNAQLSALIVANVTKTGYVSNSNPTTISIIPVAQGGWSLTTILLIMIPIVIAVLVVVLIKLKIIVVSTGEKES
jgi:hypothetical protein